MRERAVDSEMRAGFSPCVAGLGPVELEALASDVLRTKALPLVGELRGLEAAAVPVKQAAPAEVVVERLEKPRLARTESVAQLGGGEQTLDAETRKVDEQKCGLFSTAGYEQGPEKSVNNFGGAKASSTKKPSI